MKRKEAFKKVIIDNSLFNYSYNRNAKKRWIDDYGQEEFNTLKKLGYLIPSNPMIKLGESYYTEYYEFTNKGTLWKEWYHNKWFFFKTYIFRYYDIKIWVRTKYENIRYKLTGKRPDWWEYRDVDINEI